MRSLMVHKANMTEIQAVFKRWNPDGHPCDEYGCTLEGYSWRSSSIVKHIVNSEETVIDWHEVWLPPLFRTFGGRIAHFAVGASENYGRVRVSFAVDMEVSPAAGINEYYAANELSGATLSGMWFHPQDDWQGLTLHSNYVIGGVHLNAWYPPGATSVYVAFGPHADPADTARLMSFDLSCLTRWVPCRKPGDLMPEAAAQWKREEFQIARARKDHTCGPDMIGLMARDAEHAGVVEATGNDNEHLTSEGLVSVPSVRMIENLKPDDGWKTGENRYLDVYDVNTDRNVTNLPPEVRPGNRFIILAETEKHYPVRAERCGIVALNPANLELVRNAIAGTLPPPKP